MVVATKRTGELPCAADNDWTQEGVVSTSSDADRPRSDELDRLVATAKRFSASLDHETVLAAIVEDATTLLDATSGDMLFWERERGTLRVVAVWGLPADLIGYELRFGEGVSSAAIVEGRTLQVDDYATYPNRARALDRYRFGSVLCAPLLFRGDAIGAINVHTSDTGRRFRPDDADLLQAFAGLAAIAIDHARRFENEVRLGRELARTNADLVRSLTLQRRLSEQVLAGGGPASIAGELAHVLDRPVVIEDHLARPVAGASPDGGDGWLRLLSVGAARTGRRSRRGGGARTDRNGGSAPPVDRAGSKAGDGVPAQVPVLVGDELVGRLTLGPHDEPGPLDRALADIAATGVALEFAKIRAALDVEHRIRGDVVSDLLTGAYTSEEAIAGRAARLGYVLADLRDVLVVGLERDAGAVASQSDAAAVQLERRIVERIGDVLADAAPGSAVAAMGHQFVVLAAERQHADLVSSEALAAALRRAVGAILPDGGVSVAVDGPCHGPAELAAAYRLARESLELMTRLGRRDLVVDGRALGPYRMLLKATDPDELRAFAIRTLGPLLELDRRTGSDLVETLRAYLEEGASRRRAAARLFVHVNTVVYRLERIERALGRSLADPELVFELTLALRIGALTDEGVDRDGAIDRRRPASPGHPRSRRSPATRDR